MKQKIKSSKVKGQIIPVKYWLGDKLAMSPELLCKKLKISETLLTKIVTGKRQVPVNVANLIDMKLNIDAYYWIAFDKKYNIDISEFDNE